MRITSEEVKYIALLARIGMSDEEVEEIRGQMSRILENFDALRQVNTTGVDPTGHSGDLDTVMRDDDVAESSPKEDVLANTPLREGDFVRVKAVLE